MFGKILTLAIAGVMVCIPATARDEATNDSTAVQSRPTIVDAITRSGSTVSQPQALLDRLIPAADTHSAHSGNGGYRIQVFSDSNPRTAKAEAERKASAISSRFPDIKTYVTYQSPYWRLRVGDFTTFEDANDALTELKNALPAYRREMRVVRDRINRAD